MPRRPRPLAAAALFVLGVAVASAAVLAVLAWLDLPLDARGRVVFLDPDSGADARYHVGDPEHSYAPLPGARVRARRTLGDTTFYDVLYTIDANGLRATPGTDEHAVAFLFFGDSMTFGEGVGDGETLPAAFASDLAHPANVRNLGFHGYGPHQMVRMLETRRADALVPAGVARVLYQSHPWHAARAAGRSPWEVGGPRYVADGAALDGGGVRYAGPRHAAPVAFVLRLVNRVPPLRALRERLLTQAPLSADERELHLRLLRRAAALARERWDAPFTVLHWDDGSPEDDRFLEELAAAGVDVVRVSDVIPRERWDALSIPGDGHPTGEAYALLGGALAQRYGDAIEERETQPVSATP